MFARRLVRLFTRGSRLKRRSVGRLTTLVRLEQKTLTRRRCAGVAQLPLRASGALPRHALLIGTSRYRCRPFSHLEAPRVDLQALHGVLTAANIGGFEAGNPLCDQPAFHLAMELESFFRDRERDDILLLCIAGHVLVDERGACCLITHGTERARWRSSVIDFSFLREVMDQCRTQQQVVILDAAVGAFDAAGPPLDTRVDIEAALGGPERVVISASNTIRYRVNELVSASHGRSSHPMQPAIIPRIVQGLGTGEADLDGDGRVSLDDLRGYLRGG